MGRRPKHAGRDPTRERILDAAVDVFAELGYEGASLRLIGKRARLNPAAINYHFDSKHRMWLAAGEHLARPLIAIAARAIVPGRPVREALRTFLGELFDAFVVDPRPARLLLWGTLQAGTFDFDETLSRYQPIIEVGVGYYQAAQRAGQIPAEIDVPVVLPQIFSMFMNTFITQAGQRRHFGADLSDPKLAARMKLALLAGAERLLGLDRPVPKRARRRARA